MQCMYVSMYLCIYVSMYLCIYVSMYLCIYVSMYLCIYVSQYLCIYVSMFVCIPTYNHIHWLKLTFYGAPYCLRRSGAQKMVPDTLFGSKVRWKAKELEMGGVHKCWLTTINVRCMLVISITTIFQWHGSFLKNEGTPLAGWLRMEILLEMDDF